MFTALRGGGSGESAGLAAALLTVIACEETPGESATNLMAMDDGTRRTVSEVAG